ncbi:hypothetical protein DC345_11240 [Paenibacillus taichungensis]|uniref:Uncharacterized protein n=1 Tax=Paenibacillus taichungensis TaxID=484184 RepID=A0A329QVM7_9BACL|nr:hypothetical protein DC345_11240 [Paenibacillus taichungensis]
MTHGFFLGAKTEENKKREDQKPPDLDPAVFGNCMLKQAPKRICPSKFHLEIYTYIISIFN